MPPVNRETCARTPAIRTLRRCCLALLVLPALLACDRTGSPVDPHPPLPTSCNENGGTVHTGSTNLGQWRAQDGPHRLRDTVAVQTTLVIEAGTLVCGGAGAWLTAESLTIEGTADSPVRLTAEDPAAPWGGIQAWDMVVEHAVIEDAQHGLEAFRTMDVRSSTIRRIQQSGIMVWPSATAVVFETVIDSACLAPCITGAVDLAGRSLRLEDSRILDSGGAGLRAYRNSRLTLLGGSIERSAGLGLDLNTTPGREMTVVEATPTRIEGGATYPASVPAAAMPTLLPTAESYAAWQGNASDTVIVQSSAIADMTVHPGLVWWFTTPGLDLRIGRLTLAPGARVHMDRTVSVRQLISAGTVAAPVRITSTRSGTPQLPTRILLLSLDVPDTSRITHTHLEGVRLHAQVSFDLPREDVRSFLSLEDVLSVGGDIHLAAPGARLDRVTLSGAHPDADAPLTISASDIDVTRCEVTGSDRDGIVADTARAVRIADCNIHGNAGVGLRNRDADLLDARHNWWGDAAGPDGPAGDGVSDNVLFQPFHTQPVDTGAPATTSTAQRRTSPPS